MHPLDGHGYLRAFRFDENDEVKFMAKDVKTEAHVEEHDPVTDTWRFTHRGPFSVLKGGRRVGNTKVSKYDIMDIRRSEYMVRLALTSGSISKSYDWQSGKLDPSIMNINGSQGTSTLPHLVQVSINLDANGISQRCDTEPLKELNKSSDFPVINPAFSGSKNNYIYAAASSGSRSALPSFPFDMVVKYNASTKSVHTWSVGSRIFIGEPTFIAKGSNSEEDEGYILLVEYAVAVQRCYLVILDSKKIGAADALVARLEVPKHLNFPLGFHGFWATD